MGTDAIWKHNFLAEILALCSQMDMNGKVERFSYVTNLKLNKKQTKINNNNALKFQWTCLQRRKFFKNFN